MAFQNKNLSVIAYANGWTAFYYRGFEETLEDTCADNYFLPAKDLCAKGDIIIINAQDGTSIKVITEINSETKTIKLGSLM